MLPMTEFVVIFICLNANSNLACEKAITAWYEGSEVKQMIKPKIDYYSKRYPMGARVIALSSILMDGQAIIPIKSGYSMTIRKDESFTLNKVIEF
jgi:hypothetical protein